MQPTKTPWLVTPCCREDADVRLVCFPAAGAGVSAYRSWGTTFPASIEVSVAQLPGRERRIREPARRSIEAVLEELLPTLAEWLHGPYALFGHSFGALIAFEVARRLPAETGVAPSRLFVAACEAPQVRSGRPRLNRLPDEQFLQAVRRLDGIPAAVLAHRELLELVLPALRADITAHETYASAPEPKLTCPISAFVGRDDPWVEQAVIHAWKEVTDADLTVRVMPGGHFFPQTQRRQLIEHMLDDLRGTVREKSARR